MRSTIATKNSDYNRGNVVRRRVSSKQNNGAKEIESDSHDWAFLDLFSTSQTFTPNTAEIPLTCAPSKCFKNAPLFAYHKHDKTYGVVQGCCNSWNCPRCGKMRAKHEYGRIIEGCRTLAKEYQLWFITVTCRGRDMTKQEADDGYGTWTNRLLTTWRTFATRRGDDWYYAQVTERQKRGHPHSHILTTFNPHDTYMGKKVKWGRENDGRMGKSEVDTLISPYIQKSVTNAGLGSQYDISIVASVEGASRYVAKYLFKDTIFDTVWPKGWKRVRYSQSFPKLPDRETNAFVLIKREDWIKLGYLAETVTVDTDYTREIVTNALGYGSITIK